MEGDRRCIYNCDVRRYEDGAENRGLGKVE